MVAAAQGAVAALEASLDPTRQTDCGKRLALQMAALKQVSEVSATGSDDAPQDTMLMMMYRAAILLPILLPLGIPPCCAAWDKVKCWRPLQQTIIFH